MHCYHIGFFCTQWADAQWFCLNWLNPPAWLGYPPLPNQYLSRHSGKKRQQHAAFVQAVRQDKRAAGAGVWHPRGISPMAPGGI